MPVRKRHWVKLLSDPQLRKAQMLSPVIALPQTLLALLLVYRKGLHMVTLISATVAFVSALVALWFFLTCKKEIARREAKRGFHSRV
jgi:hypothetical protein